MSNISIDNLANEIAKGLAEYTSEVEEKLESAKDEVTKKAVKELKQKSPRLTGDYAKGWSRKKQGNGYVIYNKTNYQLTHLLEYGHAKSGGGRVSAKVHIRPVEEKAIKEFEEAVERAIES